MSNSQHSTKPRRRGLAAWLAFGAAGLATGAVWATGFASIGGQTDPASGVSPIVAPSTPDDHDPALSGVVTAGSPLSVVWSGRWGAISANTSLFTVDLSEEPAGQSYNVAFLLTNTTDISDNGWSSLQLKVEEVDVGTGSCDAAAFDGTTVPKVMAFDSQDAGVYWNGLAGGTTYCIGVKASDGQDTDGTFIRRASDTVAPTVYPRFLATVDRAL